MRIIPSVGVAFDAGLQTGLQGNALFHDEGTADEARIVCESLAISLSRSVDIQMVGIDGCNHGYIGRKMMERAVVFVGLHHHILVLRVYQHIGVVVQTDAAQKGIDAR